MNLIYSESFPLIISLVVTAFLGSWHCGAMCGPIAASLKDKIISYHLGRFVSYGLLGTVAGFIGQQGLSQLSLTQSIFAAVLMSVLFVVVVNSNLLQRVVHETNLFKKMYRYKAHGFLLGFATAALPCGWLWTFIAAAAITKNPLTGFFVTTVLWLSSLPALSLVNLYFRKTLPQAPYKQRRVISFLLTIAGLYSIWSHIVFGFFP